MLNWIFWAIPPEYVRRYFVMMWLALFFLPGFIFGLQFTKLGLIINILWFDLIFYGWVRAKQTIEGDKE